MSSGSMQVPVGRAVTVRVPATSANLGPGFDTLGLALGFYDQLEVSTRSESGATVEVIGEGAADSAAPVSTDASNLVVQSIAHAFAQHDGKVRARASNSQQMHQRHREKFRPVHAASTAVIAFC